MSAPRQYRVKWRVGMGLPRPTIVVDDGDVFLAVSQVAEWGENGVRFPLPDPHEEFDLLVTLYPAEEVR